MTLNDTFDPNAAAQQDSGVFGLPCQERNSAVVLIPVPFDATTSYRRGTALGPQAIFQASKQVDLFDHHTGKPYESGIFMSKAPENIKAANRRARKYADPVIAAGGVSHDEKLIASAAKVNAISQEVNHWVFQQTTQSLANNKIVGIIGGDHSVPYGAIIAYAQKYPNLGILHIDAHADLRIAFEGFEWSHASIMYNVVTKIPQLQRLVQVGIRDFCQQEHEIIEQNAKIVTFFDADLSEKLFRGIFWHQICVDIVAHLPEHVYLSIDIDGLDASFCPNTGTPVPGGLSFQQLAYLLKIVVESKKTIVGFDLNEVAPAADQNNEWDAIVGARLLYKMIGFTLMSHKKSGGMS